MKVVVNDVSRDIKKLIADNGIVVEIAGGNLYSVSFFYQINNHVFESQTSIVFEGDLSFQKAEELVKQKLEGGGVE